MEALFKYLFRTPNCFPGRQICAWGAAANCGTLGASTDQNRGVWKLWKPRCLYGSDMGALEGGFHVSSLSLVLAFLANMVPLDPSGLQVVKRGDTNYNQISWFICSFISCQPAGTILSQTRGFRLSRRKLESCVITSQLGDLEHALQPLRASWTF